MNAPTIKAIETVYKGYRFRSRLEARWAVFFDQLGIRWEYERQGYDLGGVRYLPDFWIPEKNLHLEVKPGPRPHGGRLRVYMAGRMGKPQKNGYRKCWRPFDVYDDRLSGLDYAPPVPKRFGGCDITYTGPFMTGLGRHCSVHGDADDRTTDAEQNCFIRAVSGVSEAEVVFAWLDDLEAYGTLVEIGLAYGLKKKIVVGLGGAVSEAAESAFCHGVLSLDEAAVDRGNPLWFACMMADKIFTGEKVDVLDEFSDFIRLMGPVPREQRLIDSLARMSGEPACIVYGDPVDATDLRMNAVYASPCAPSTASELISWGTPGAVKLAAMTARQARFEHGQHGAVR